MAKHVKRISRGYKAYRFSGKDPVIEIMKQLIAARGLKVKDVAKRSGVTSQALYKWFHKDGTKAPMYKSVAAVASALLYEPRFQRLTTDKPKLRLIGSSH